jgi:NodT family efflux transporter outer membrane factor (OMF) lipoprotein
MSDRAPSGGCPPGVLGMTLVATAMSSCAVGPEFRVPPAPYTSGYTGETLPDATEATNTVGGTSQRFQVGRDLSGQWWDLFASTQLTALIDEAMASYPEVAAQQAALRAARENVRAQRGQFLPQVEGVANGNREKVSGASIGPGFSGFITNIFQATVNVSYTIDLFGGERRVLEGLVAQVQARKFQLEASYLTLTSNVASSVIQLASLNDQVAATNDIIASEAQQLELIRRQVDVGSQSLSDVMQQESSLAQIRATLPRLEQQRSIAQHQLAVLTGHMPNDGKRPVLSLSDLTLPADLPVSLPATLVAHRPDIQVQEAQMRQASASVGVATANLLPQLTLTGSSGGDSLVSNTLFQPESGVWNLAAGVTQPIFQAGTLRAKRRSAIDAYEQASAEYRLTVLKAFQDVADTLTALEHDAQALKAESDALNAAKASLGLIQNRFDAGTVSFISLLTAQQGYAQARLAFIRTLASRYTDTVTLFQALGGGWWNRVDHGTANLTSFHGGSNFSAAEM